MKTDKQLQQDVLAELKWEPSIDSAHIGVAAADGVVTLSGHVKSYAEKVAAERAAKRVRGVQAIAQEIDVHFPSDPKLSDDEIAGRITQMLEWDVLVPDDRLQVKVEKGWVTLTGTVDWQYQKTAAEKDASKISGVKGVSNLIELKPIIAPDNVRSKIEAAFERNAEVEASDITVKTEGSKVILGGWVRAWYEREIAEKAAWSAPGVTQVEDHIMFG